MRAYLAILFAIAIAVMCFAVAAEAKKEQSPPSAPPSPDSLPSEQLPVQILHPSNTSTVISGDDLRLMWTAPGGVRDKIYFQMHHIPVFAIMKKRFVAQLPTVGADASRLTWKTPLDLTTDTRFQLTAYWAANGTLCGRSQLFSIIARKVAEKWKYPLDETPPVLPMTGPFDRRFFDLPFNGAGRSAESSALPFPAVIAFVAAYLMI